MMQAVASGKASAVGACISGLRRRASGGGSLSATGDAETVRRATTTELGRTSDKGETILHHAAQSGSIDMVKRVLELIRQLHAMPSLVQQQDTNTDEAMQGSSSSRGGTGARSASTSGSSAPSKLAWLEHCSTQGYTPLALAAKHGHSETVLALLLMGASPGPAVRRDRQSGRRASGHTEHAHGGADTDKASERDDPDSTSSPSPQRPRVDTPLALATEFGSFRAIDVLLKARADPNASPPASATPLMRAAKAGRPDLVLHLLRAGASPSQSNAFGMSPLMEAVRSESETHLRCAKLLLGRRLPQREWVRSVTVLSDGESEQYLALLKSRPGVEPQIKPGVPPTPTPRSVLKVGTPGEGADPDATEGVRGETALHLAVRADSSLVVQLLLICGMHVPAWAS